MWQDSNTTLFFSGAKTTFILQDPFVVNTNASEQGGKNLRFICLCS